MKAVLLQKSRQKLDDTCFVEVIIWQVASPLSGSAHHFKYRLACVSHGVCVLRYDNEAGKGDHKHIGLLEVSYTFTTLDQLVEDFWADIAQL